MDKLRLNNEIILCRPAVRKAKVHLIRKLLKNIKILKSCNNENLKEKKLRKADRLFEKVQIMKRTRVDDVTKFALRTDLENPREKSSLERNALALLAKHKAIVERVNNIREQIPDWRTVLPPMLETLGRKRLARFNWKKTKKGKKKGKPSNEKPVEVAKTRTNDDMKVKRQFKEKVKPIKTVKRLVSSSDDEESESLAEDGPEAKIQEEKIEDPFFIQKKVIAPMLVQESVKKSNGSQPIRDSSLFHMKPFKAKKEPRFIGSGIGIRKPVAAEEEEKLHPSWAAKKIKLIKPFEGKKIKFSED